MAIGVALVAGVLLFVASASPGTVLAPLAWTIRGSWFDAVMFGLALPALPFGLWKATHADVRERRRYSVFVAGLAVGFLPIAAQVLAEATAPAYAAFINVPPRRLLVGLVLYPLLLSIPLTTAYAVVVHRVMDVKVLVRRAVQYALARFTIVALAAAPAVLLVVALVRNRDQTIGALFTTSALSTLVPLAALLLVLAVRRPLLERIDRMFFREAVDTRTLLGALAASTTEARGDRFDAVCQTFSDQIRSTLHLAQADVLVADWEAGHLSSGTRRLRPLPLASRLAAALTARPDPLVIELDQPGGWVQALSLDDQQWLADGDVHLLVPLRSGNEFVGVMALGEKLNDLPFSRDDQAQLAPVAAALALKIENLRLREAPIARPGDGPGARADDAPAVVCGRCGVVAAAGTDPCPACGGEVAPTQLPAVLAGKFRLERELGRGGMGVVYLAFDSTLERRVAIKTLPRVSMAESVRLRREARAMAGFAHPHLALIFGLESWRGSPALVMEYLDGGTLADRLRRARLSPREVVALAHDLAGAIASIHDDGLLHRDIKPSNIAFTSAGQPKLLDFGLAQIFVAARPRAARRHAPGTAASWTIGANLTTVDHLGRFAGTPAYMAPEALGGDELDTAADLWSFGAVLFECLTGERPFAERPLDAPGIDWVREIQAHSPECPAALGELVGDLLAADKRRRPASAHLVRTRLLEQATLRVA